MREFAVGANPLHVQALDKVHALPHNGFAIAL
jgi:hypothetical protein